jgi:hypothetical protein
MVYAMHHLCAMRWQLSHRSTMMCWVCGELHPTGPLKVCPKT